MRRWRRLRRCARGWRWICWPWCRPRVRRRCWQRFDARGWRRTSGVVNSVSGDGVTSGDAPGIGTGLAGSGVDPPSGDGVTRGVAPGVAAWLVDGPRGGGKSVCASDTPQASDRNNNTEAAIVRNIETTFQRHFGQTSTQLCKLCSLQPHQSDEHEPNEPIMNPTRAQACSRRLRVC